MINLLPPAVKSNFRYARKNSFLLKIAVGIGAGVIGIIFVVGAGGLFINHYTSSYVSLVSSANQQFKANNLSQTETQIKSTSNNLKLVVQVLSREVLFSQLLQQIGKALPSGSVLENLNITGESGGIDLQAAAVDYQTASQIQVNLADPANGLFSKADIVSIQCQSTNLSKATNYPCKVDIRAQFTASNPFLFINNKATSGAPS